MKTTTNFSAETGFEMPGHRVILTYETEARNVTSEAIIKKIFDTIAVP